METYRAQDKEPMVNTIVWFQNYRTSEPNYGWFDKNIRSNKELYREALMELVAEEIKPFLNM